MAGMDKGQAIMSGSRRAYCWEITRASIGEWAGHSGDCDWSRARGQRGLYRCFNPIKGLCGRRPGLARDGPVALALLLCAALVGDDEPRAPPPPSALPGHCPPPFQCKDITPCSSTCPASFFDMFPRSSVVNALLKSTKKPPAS